MFAVIWTFAEIAFRKRGPEDLPDSGFLLGLTVVAYLILQLPVALPVYSFSAELLQNIMLEIGFLCLFLWGLLVFAGYRSRYRQTLTAFFGTGVLLTVLLIPLNYWWQSAAGPGSAPALPTAAILALIIWSLVINAHIVSRAISTSFTVGLIIAVAYFSLNYMMLMQMAPPVS
jgi:hypothetical protein